MDNISVWMNVNEVLLKGGFLIFLAAAGYQDLKDRRRHICLFLAFGTAGAALKGIHMVLELRSYIAGYGMEEAWIQAGKHFKDTGMAVMVGGALLALSAATGEGVGRGDGWFFVVSGIYLDFARNLLFLCRTFHEGHGKRQGCKAYASSVFAVPCAGRDGSDVFVKGEKWYVKGSFTVEAACIMAAVLLSISMIIHQAARIRDETVGAMGLHEAVEKGRHEKGAELHVVASMVQDNMGRPMTLSGYQIQLKSRWNRISGKAQGTGWSHEIEGKRFRPEAFLRKITLIEGLGEEDGD